MKAKVSFLALAVPCTLLAVIAVAAPVSENWDNHCAKCHGADGKGETKAGRKLKVRDYTDPAVQAEMKDDEMLKAIAEGLTNEKGKELMKAYKDELSPEEMAELVTFIRKLRP